MDKWKEGICKKTSVYQEKMKFSFPSRASFMHSSELFLSRITVLIN